MPNEIVTTTTPGAEMATLDVLLDTVIRERLAPPPTKRTLRSWLNDAGVKVFKPYSTMRGGGAAFYRVQDVLEFLDRGISGGAQ
jgi:hypothetical protein